MIVGITGSVGTGKSTVSKMFEEKGAHRIDADKLAHEAIEKGKAPYRSVVRFFGKRILRPDESVDRRLLAGIVFGNRKKLKALNARIHPYVLRRIRDEIRRISASRKTVCIVVEVPLLHEGRLARMFDVIVTVSCAPSIRRVRWSRRGGTVGELEKRSASQLPLSVKEKHSDFIIDNSGNRQMTRTQVGRIWKVIKAKT